MKKIGLISIIVVGFIAIFVLLAFTDVISSQLALPLGLCSFGILELAVARQKLSEGRKKPAQISFAVGIVIICLSIYFFFFGI